MAPTIEPRVHYTVIVRLPFPRGDFEDPPQVDWDASKDRKLWKIISRNPKSGDIDWADRAAEFGVTQTFLLQQAAWLYERHLRHVKAQMTKIRTSSTVTTPVQGGSGQVPHQPLTSVAMKRLGSGGASRTPSSLSVRSRDSPVPRTDTSIPGTPRIAPPPLSRNPSATTVTQSKHFLPPSPHQRSTRPVPTNAPTRRFETNAAATPLSPAAETTTSSPASSSSSSSSSSSDGELISRSHAFRRPPRFQARKPSLAEIDGDDSDDDEDSPTFLPFAQPNAASKTPQPRMADPGATIRGVETRPATTGRFEDVSGTGGHRSKAGATTSKEPDTNDGARTPERTGKGKGKQPAARPAGSSPASSSASSASAAFLAGNPVQGSSLPQQPKQAKGHHHRVETLSPRHRSELARLSPRRQGSKALAGSGGHGHENSDGTPSMGSSFSDLDDTSITQSALEEALASNLRHGGASRLSNISHAFRSRYM